MNVIILAAGRGSRLGQGMPKALLTLDNGRTLLEQQLLSLAPYCPLETITVVVGFEQQKIRQAFPFLRFVENPDFDQENTAKSLLRALQAIPKKQDLLWINGDVLFPSHALSALFSQTRCHILGNRASVGAEEVKFRTNGRGKVLEISKTVVHPEGESVGIQWFNAASLPLFLKMLEACKPKDYFEAAVQSCIENGTEVYLIETAADLCVEIDFPEDLVKANRLALSENFNISPERS